MSGWGSGLPGGEPLPGELFQQVYASSDRDADVRRALWLIGIRAERHGLKVISDPRVEADGNLLRITVDVRSV